MKHKRRCRGDVIRSHQLASRLGIGDYARTAGVSESTLRKMLRGDEVSLLSISTVAKHLGIATDALIDGPTSESPSARPSQKHEMRIELVLECSASAMVDVKRAPDMISEALQTIAIPGLSIFRHSTEVRIKATNDAHLRVPIRLEALTSLDRSSRHRSVYYATIRPSMYEKFVERVVWQSLHLPEISNYGEIILWQDSRIRFSDDSSLLSLFSELPLSPPDPKGLLCFVFYVVGSPVKGTDATQVLEKCVIDLARPAIRRAFLDDLQKDIFAVAAHSLSRPSWITLG